MESPVLDFEDFVFSDKKKNRYSRQVGLGSVYHAICGKPLKIKTITDVALGCGQVQLDWIPKLENLILQVGAEKPLASQLQRIRRCPPFASSLKDKTKRLHCCNLPSICPHCWARQTAHWFTILDSLLFPGDPKNKPRFSVYGVASYHARIEAPFLVPRADPFLPNYKPVPFLEEDKTAAWLRLLDLRGGLCVPIRKRIDLVGSRTREFASITNAGALGVVESFQLDHVANVENCAVATVRQLRVYNADDAGGKIAVFAAPSVDFAFHRQIKRQDLARLVQEFLPYPAGLLADPAAFRSACSIRRKRRLIESKGLIRSHRSQEVARMRAERRAKAAAREAAKEAAAKVLAESGLPKAAV